MDSEKKIKYKAVYKTVEGALNDGQCVVATVFISYSTCFCLYALDKHFWCYSIVILQLYLVDLIIFEGCMQYLNNSTF